MELCLKKEKPGASITVTFEKLEGDARWKRFDSFLNQDGADKGEKIYYFLESLAGRVFTKGGKSILIAAQVDPRGVWLVTGECAQTDLETVREDFFTFVNSMQQTIGVHTVR